MSNKNNRGKKIRGSGKEIKKGTGGKWVKKKKKKKKQKKEKIGKKGKRLAVVPVPR